MSQSTILARVASGDANAVEECLDQYGGLVWSLARRFLSSQEEAEDAVQEIFVEVWKSAGRYDSSVASEQTFIAVLARRRLIDRIRKFKRRPDLVNIEDTAPVAFNDHLAMERGVEAAAAVEVLETLKPEQRRAIELSVLSGLSHSEVAEAMSLPLGTVKSYIRRGLISIREQLEKPAPGPRGAVS